MLSYEDFAKMDIESVSEFLEKHLEMCYHMHDQSGILKGLINKIFNSIEEFTPSEVILFQWYMKNWVSLFRPDLASRLFPIIEASKKRKKFDETIMKLLENNLDPF